MIDSARRRPLRVLIGLLLFVCMMLPTVFAAAATPEGISDSDYQWLVGEWDNTTRNGLSYQVTFYPEGTAWIRFNDYSGSDSPYPSEDIYGSVSFSASSLTIKQSNGQTSLFTVTEQERNPDSIAISFVQTPGGQKHGWHLYRNLFYTDDGMRPGGGNQGHAAAEASPAPAPPTMAPDVITVGQNVSVMSANNNLANGGHLVYDGERLYFVHAINGKFHLYAMGAGMTTGAKVQTKYRSDARYSYLDGYLYFSSKSDFMPVGLYRLPFRNGQVTDAPESVAPQGATQYCLDEQGLYYAITKKEGIWHRHPDGKVTLLAPHAVPNGNNLIRMMTYNGILYYVNDADRCLWAVRTDGTGEPARLSDTKIHYFVMAEHVQDAVLVYVHYARNDALDRSTLGAMGLDGSPIPTLDWLGNITSRYINAAGRTLYYADSKRDFHLKTADLNINEYGKTVLNRPVGYPHVFDADVFVLGLEKGDVRYVYLFTQDHAITIH